MPIHFLKWHRPKKWLRTVWELDRSDLARTSLDGNVDNSENPVSVFATVGCEDLDIADFLQFETLDQVCRDGKLCCACVNKGIATDILAPAFFRKKLILPISQRDRHTKYAHDEPPDFY